jgi:PAS domain S-box-containing protein
MALLLRVVLFSTLVTLVLTILQLSLSYGAERKRLENRLYEIDQANAASIAESLWALDARQLEVQVQGILRLPSIRRVEIRETGRPAGGFVLLRGERTERNVLWKETRLSCCGAQAREIGVLRIEATLTDIYRDLMIQALVILLSNGAKTFLVAFFILFVVHRLATRHLLDIAESVNPVTAEPGPRPLQLRRHQARHDELDQLVDAINAMRERLEGHATELRNANLRMATILDNMPDMAWVKDADGRFMAINRAMASAKGLSDPGQLVGLTDLDGQPDEHAAAYRRDDELVMARRCSLRFEELHVNADGTTLLIETLKSPLLDADGRVVGTVGVARDISARRQAEADRAARREAELASRTKSEFVAHISHEIRTPMNAIIGMAQLAEYSGMPRAQLDYVRKIHRAARMLMGIVNDILDLAKIESGKLTVESVAFDLPTVLRDVIELLESTAQEKGLELRLHLPGALPGRVMGDPTRLRQVLLNLVANAVKFTRQGRVELSLQLLAVEATALRLHFEVSDTGIGMSDEVLRELFTPFSQGDASMTRRYGGTGLGLAISRQLVRLMGGDIEVRSTLDAGSRFSFELRLDPAPASDVITTEAHLAPTNPGQGAALRGVHLLLVEDNPVNQEIAEAMLMRLGAQVTCAADGRMALQQLEQARFDAVLMDCQMPVMDGYEATRRMRQDARWRTLPVIALTAYACNSDLDDALAAGMNDHVSKPIAFDQLLSVLQRWLRATEPAPQPQADD